MSLKNLNLKEEYRSDTNDIVAEFFFPCLSNCIQYDRCVNFLSIQALATISMAFDNFDGGKAKLRMMDIQVTDTKQKILTYLQNYFLKNLQNHLKGNL